MKRLDCECCTITIEINEFYPIQYFQQIGIMVMALEKPMENHFRVTYTLGKAYDTALEVFSNNKKKEIKQRKIQPLVQRDGEIIHESGQHICFPEISNLDPSCIDTLFLRLSIQGNWAFWQRKENFSWQGFFEPQDPFNFPFEPAYLALGAFQGNTDAMGNPLNADTIPGLINYIKVEPCDNPD